MTNFRNLKISYKIFVTLFAIASISVGALGIVDYLSARDSIFDQEFKKLTAVRELKAQQIEAYFATIVSQIITFSESRTVIEATRAFQQGVQDLETKYSTGGTPEPRLNELIDYYEMEFLPRLQKNVMNNRGELSPASFLPGSHHGIEMQNLYIAENPYPTGEKHKLDFADDGSLYSKAHQKFHPIMRRYLAEFGFYDIFIVDHATGEIIYSVFKEVDFATSLLTGPYRETNFSRVFRSSAFAREADFVNLQDYETYYPSYNAPAAFISSPIFDGDKKIGVLVFQMPIDRINDIMTSAGKWRSVGLGDSGETYIVGADFLMRNQSRFLLEDRENYLREIRLAGTDEGIVQRIESLNSTIGLQSVVTKGTQDALAGQSNTLVFPDYRGVDVLSSYRPLILPDMSWAIMSEIDASEAFAPVTALRNRSVVIMTLLLFAILGVSLLLARTMSRPIKDLTNKALILARGDLGIKIHSEGGDEIAQLAGSFEQMRIALRDMINGLELRVKERTKELQDSETRIRTIFENAADGIIVINAKGVIQSFSPSAERIFGYSADEVSGSKVDMLMPEPMRNEHDSYLERYFTTGEKRVVGHNREVVGLRSDGSTFPMGLAVGEGQLGDETIFIGIVRDITERKKIESELEQAKAAAEAANQAKSTFLANMSHELRTPMNAIIGYSEMLAEDAEDDGNEEYIPDLNKIHASGKHLLALINDILDLSKIEAGKIELNPESFDLLQMMQDSLAILEPLVIKNQNQLVTDFADDLGIVKTDITKLKQSLFNLVSNAAKFTSKGQITIAAHRESGADGEMIRIEVSDTGIGIPENKLEKIFDEFGQADESTTKDYGGTGLGLSISRRFCRMMGGDLVVSSEEGVGSTFSILMPAQIDAETAPQKPVTKRVPKQQQDVGANTILIIDDDPVACDLISRMLQGEGYSVITASNGAEGLALARAQRPGTITLDIQMPDMDGWSVLQALKEDPELRDIPVIMVSIVGDEEKGYALGAVESLPKPLERNALLEVIGRHANLDQSGTALVVEDDEANRGLLVRVLSEAGWQVLEATNGAEGLERVSETKPDLILLDLMMPVMDGFEFVLELRKHPDYLDIPVVVVTAKDLTDEDHFRLTGGVEKIIQKGAFSRTSFLNEIKTLIGKLNKE